MPSFAFPPNVSLPRCSSRRHAPRRVCRLVQAKSTTGGLSAELSTRGLKKALDLAGVDTTSCFERGDLESLFETLPEAQRVTLVAAVAESRGGRSSADAAASSGAAGPSVEAKEAAAPGAGGQSFQELVASLQAFIQDQFLRFQSSVKAASEKAESQFGLAAQGRILFQRARDALLKLDAKLGVGAAVRDKGPEALRAFNAFRETPVGRVVSFLFTAWLFVSGAFWSILSWAFLALLITNVVAPNFLRNRIEAAVADATREAQAQAASRAGAGGQPGAAGWPPRGGADTGGGGRRRDLSGGDSASVVDVDAKVR